ncbi:MAG TPA: M20/M25/M40 family metallo-hydrolase, partial [Crenalkalicoccus sp.]|nr:M20/M25/M40 family metallo-hydrolase [Crenalkalicoccus sp.]
MPHVTHYAAMLERELPAILAMTERSVNLDSGSYLAGGVNAVIDIWAGMLADLGFTVQRKPLPGFGDQMTARLALGGSGPRLLILGHADTVWPAGVAAEWPFARQEGRLTGPGVGDMKTNVVMALHALKLLLAEDALEDLASVTMLVVPDEEIGSPGSRDWIEAEARQSDLCLTLEPCRPKGGLVVGRGAVGAVYLSASGVTAHCGSAREAGASAIAALATLVAPLEALGDPANGLSTTAGIFRGGEARQVVPGSAELHLDLRAPDDATAEALLAEVRSVVERTARDPRVSVTLRGGFTRPAFPTHPGTRAL